MNAVLFAVLVLTPLISVCAEVTECDRLAANPPDPDRVAEGVPRSEVNIEAAVTACKNALAADPENARFAYQLGRVYFYGGDTTNALKYIEQAASQGYRQAEFVMGALADNRREGVPADICTVEDYWYRAASKGHLHARVAYVRHVTKGRFDSCKIQATAAELTSLIDIQASGSASYFLRLLVDDLKEDVAAYRNGSENPQH
jgi:TPR repeat protein